MFRYSHGCLPACVATAGCCSAPNINKCSYGLLIKRGCSVSPPHKRTSRLSHKPARRLRCSIVRTPLTLVLNAHCCCAADIDGCAGNNPCSSDTGSTGVCRDVAAANVGHTCECSTGYTWNATSGSCTGALANMPSRSLLLGPPVLVCA